MSDEIEKACALTGNESPWLAEDAMRALSFDIVVGQAYPDLVAECRHRMALITERYGIETPPDTQPGVMTIEPKRIPMTTDALVKELRLIDSDQWEEVMTHFCKMCGGQPGCQCWNDE